MIKKKNVFIKRKEKPTNNLTKLNRGNERHKYANGWLVGWLDFMACQPIGLVYAEYVFIYKLTFFYEHNFL